jgi:hypothetical protein
MKILLFTLALMLAVPAAAQSPSVDDPSRRQLESRAVEAVIWGMPAVNFDLMREAALKAKATDNQVVYWSRLPDWKNQTLTPNPDSIYLMPFYDVKNGPVVLEIPPTDDGSFVGSIDDCWQTAIEDVGPAGFDKGKGGKYLILPPGYKDQVPDGYFAMPSNNYRGFAILRSILKSTGADDVAKAVAYGKRIKFYPYSQAANPPQTVFVDAIDDVFDATIPYDLRFFQALDREVQYEPWLTRDKAMIDSLKTIGIEKGKPFSPDAATRDVLEHAIAEAHAWLAVRQEAILVPPFDASARWALPASKELLAALQSNYADPDSYPVDARGVTYSYGFFSAKHLGAGQYYLMTIKDKAGQPLSGASTYRLHVPPNPPVTLYWSATVYDSATHALVRDAKWSSRSSQTAGLQKNADGSVDVYFGATAPAGKETNWVPTNANGGFEVLFRLYGVEKVFFDKVWKLPDVEKVQ